MNKKQAYELGYDRGWNVASWTGMPEIGQRLSRDLDWQGIGTIDDVGDQIDAWETLCSEAESNDRCFSPFEFTASEINKSRDPETYWEAFDAGVQAGIQAYRRKHFKLRDMRRSARSAA